LPSIAVSQNPLSSVLASDCTTFPLSVHLAFQVQLFTLDNHLTLKQHTQSLCRDIYFHTRAFRHIRPALTDSMAATVAASVVQSHLDYANALLRGTLTGNIHKLQCAQNSLSRVVLPHHPGPASSRLSHLHWLPVCRRIQYKVALLTYKSLLINQPPYLRNLLHVYQPSHCLRSASQNLLCIPSCTINFSRRSFSFFLLLPSGTNDPPLSGSPTHWTHLNVGLKRILPL